MKKLIIVNIVVVALIALFIKANMNVSKNYAQEVQKTEKANECHLAVK